MRINHNISAMNTYRQYSINTSNASASMEKLSSGYRINRAADDAAGLSISEKMRSQIRGLTQATRNAEDGVSFIQTAEGALAEVSDMLTRLKELAVQVQNGTYSEDDKKNIGAEMKALGNAISDIYVNTKFNGIKVFGDQETITAESYNAAFVTENSLDDAKFYTLASDGTLVASDTDNKSYVADNSLSSSLFYKVTGGKLQSCATATGTYADLATQPALLPDALTTGYEYFQVIDGKLMQVDAESTLPSIEATFGATTVTTNGNIVPDALEAGYEYYQVNAEGLLMQVDADGSLAAKAATFSNAPVGSLKVNDGTAIAASIKYGEDGTQSVDIRDAKTSAMNALTTALSAAGTNPTGVTVSLVEAAITEVNTTRATYGAQQNQLDHASNNLATTKENLQSAESRVRDVDLAEEMMEYTKNNILLQAAQAMLAQANSQPQGVLQLLR